MLATLRRHPALIATFLLAVTLALWLLVEVAMGVRSWAGLGPEPLRPWMTVGYVGRTSDLDPRLIDAAAGFPTPEEAGHPLTLAEIAEREGLPIKTVFDRVEQVVDGLRAERGHGDRENPPGAPDRDGDGGGLADAPTGSLAAPETRP